jgi:prophage maintenance system killer protein
VLIAGQILGIGTDDALSQLDVAAAQAALAEARIADSAIVDQDTAAAAAIGLVDALLRHRPYPVHGERIAVAAGVQFLSLNRWRADLEPAAAAVVVEALARGQLSPAAAAAWLSPRLAAGAGRIAGAPSHPAARRGPIPPSVIYPQVLLFVQASCWALAAAPQTWRRAMSPSPGRLSQPAWRQRKSCSAFGWTDVHRNGSGERSSPPSLP